MYKEEQGYKTTTYSIDGYDGFLVDVVETPTDVPHDNPREKLYEAFLYHRDYGIKDHVVCFFAESREHFIKALIAYNIIYSEVIEDYILERMD